MLCGVLAAPASARPDTDSTPLTADGKPLVFHLHRARVILQEAYSLDRWQDATPARGEEKQRWQEHRRAILHRPTRLAIGHYRDRLERRFAEYREMRQLTPYYGGGAWWAIPWYVVACESGGDWGARNASSGASGPYQMLPSTYSSVCRSCDWSKLDQHYAAGRVWDRSGGSEWVCA